MTKSAFDTSGAVALRHVARTATATHTYWENLDPFTQGYTEALFTSLILEGDRLACLPNANGHGHTIGLGFGDISPETLAMILKDCERMQARLQIDQNHAAGGAAWTLRQSRWKSWGSLPRDLFPPLTPYLGDDGKVRFK